MRGWIGGLAVAVLLVGCVPDTTRGPGKITVTGAPDNSGVTVTDTLNDTADETVVTDASGSFHFDGDLPGLVTATAPWTVEGVQTWSSRYNNTDFPALTFTAAGAVSGRATLAGRENGDAGITVTIGSTTVTTDEVGKFTFPTMPVGNYPVSVIALGFHEMEGTVTISYKFTTELPQIDLIADDPAP